MCARRARALVLLVAPLVAVPGLRDPSVAGAVTADAQGRCRGKGCAVTVSEAVPSSNGVGVARSGDPGAQVDGTSGRRSGSTPPPLLLYVPACSGNRPGGEGNLCTAAQDCPDNTDLQYWVYERAWQADA